MRRASYLAIVLAALQAACDFDNFEPPESTLEGRVVYNGQPVNVRDNAIQLELWQDGYALRGEIPVHVRQDGSFSAKLFDGPYKLVRKQNNGPWANNTDTIRFELRGSQSMDVPVSPYFVIQNPSVQRSGTNLTASFGIQQVVAGRTLERIALYVGNTQFVDSRFNAVRAERAVNNSALTGTSTLTVDVAAAGQGRDYLFARVGVKTVGVEEMIYTPVQRIQIR